MNCTAMSRDKPWDPYSLPFCICREEWKGKLHEEEKSSSGYKVGTGRMHFIFESCCMALSVVFSSVLLSLLQNAGDNPWFRAQSASPWCPGDGGGRGRGFLLLGCDMQRLSPVTNTDVWGEREKPPVFF